LKADKKEQEKKKLAALPSQSNIDKDSCVDEAIGNDEMVLEKSIVTKDSDKKKSPSEPQEKSKVGVVLPASLDEGVHESLSFSARMKMKLPLQQTNVVVQKKTMSSNEMSLWNDADCVKGIIQSVTELFVSKDSDKKPPAEVLPNSVAKHEEISNDTTEAMLNFVPQQGESVSKDSNKKPAAEVLANSVPDHKEIANDTAEAMIDEAAETMPNSVTEWGNSSMKSALPTLMFVVILLVTM